jgi:hypothetical protein
VPKPLHKNKVINAPKLRYASPTACNVARVSQG